jgi:hypothetical protein
MEFPHLLKLIAQSQFDTIYHEHFSYLSLGTARRIFRAHALEVFDVEELPTHGGSLRIHATHAERAAPTTDRLRKVLGDEDRAGLSDPATYQRFAEQARETKRKLLTLLIELKRAGKRIAAYGAPAKGNTLLNYCGVRGDFIDFTVDRNPLKQGTLLPGTHIPVRSPDALAREKPDYVVILPWNLREEIEQQEAAVRTWGGRFIVPIPEPRVLP